MWRCAVRRVNYNSIYRIQGSYCSVIVCYLDLPVIILPTWTKDPLMTINNHQSVYYYCWWKLHFVFDLRVFCSLGSRVVLFFPWIFGEQFSQDHSLNPFLAFDLFLYPLKSGFSNVFRGIEIEQRQKMG